MPEIKVLPEDVIAKIAAGEVIERPASVLKEILENSIDAGATHIDIEIEKAGRKLMRIRDDGKGMGREDMSISLQRHSTSKLHSFDDLYSLATYGFRGEALYSISAVSRMRITSCTENAETGFTLECEGGNNITIQPAPPVKGTVIEAADLFFNIPARAKFLKSDASERAHLIRTAEESVLANCGAAFRMRIDGTEIFNVPLTPDGEAANLRRRTETVLGKKTFSGMTEINFSGGGISIHGYVSSMGNFCSTRANQYYFVNRRPVTSQLLKQAFYKAYPAIPIGKHPACVLFVDLDPSEFDVNVHPQKRDVKFSREGDIFRAMSDAVRQAMENKAGMSHDETEIIPPGGIYGRGLPPTVKYRTPEKDIFPDDNPAIAINPSVAAEQDRSEEYGTRNIPFNPESIPGITKGMANIAARPTENSSEKDKGLFEALSPKSVGGSTGTIPSEKNGIYSDPAQAWKNEDLKYIGQLAESYLLFECGRGLLLVDQHAAQERVFFEQYLEQFSQKKINRQPLLVPIEAELTRSQMENVMKWKDWLDEAGFEIDSRGPTTAMLRSSPDLFEFNEKTFSEFVSYIAEIMGNPSQVAEEIKRNVIATIACKKAIKARDSIHPSLAIDIMKKLRQCRDGAHCPHGRSTIHFIPAAELAKKFSRGTAL